MGTSIFLETYSLSSPTVAISGKVAWMLLGWSNAKGTYWTLHLRELNISAFSFIYDAHIWSRGRGTSSTKNGSNDTDVIPHFRQQVSPLYIPEHKSMMIESFRHRWFPDASSAHFWSCWTDGCWASISSAAIGRTECRRFKSSCRQSRRNRRNCRESSCPYLEKMPLPQWSITDLKCFGETVSHWRFPGNKAERREAYDSAKMPPLPKGLDRARSDL